MRDDTLDALAVKFHAANRREGLAHANGLAREGVDAAWQTLEGKLSIVSGKQLLSNLSSWSQATYGVSLSAGRLSATMSGSEMPQEVRRVVSAIERGTAIREAE